MSVPHMFIIAGPPGAGRSSLFRLSDFADKVFNADDRAAELNRGSYQGIPLSVRAVVNREFEQFVQAHIDSDTSFALETTLRSTSTFEHARHARQNGFRVFLRYIALDTVEHHIERVKRSAGRGGHSASEAALRRIHASSLDNLPLALNPGVSGIEIVRVYDNSGSESRAKLVLETRRGRVVRLADNFPQWLQKALAWSDPDLERYRRDLIRQRP